MDTLTTMRSLAQQQQRGFTLLEMMVVMTIILILGLTGWTGTFRLIRGEYLKHKAREYVQAADMHGQVESGSKD